MTDRTEPENREASDNLKREAQTERPTSSPNVRRPEPDSDERVRLKVILLQLIASFPDLTYDELLQLALDTMYMDYFTYCAIYPELENADLIRERARKEEKRLDTEGKPLKRLELTRAGRTVLETMSPSLPGAIKRFLEESRSTQQDQLRQRREVEAHYVPSPARGYDVSLALREGQNDLFRLRLQVPSEHEARALVHRWQTDSGPLYISILKLLEAGQADPQSPGDPA